MLTAAVNTVAENQDWIKIFGLKLNLDRVAFTIPIGDGYDIYWYAVIIAVGLLLAMLYGFKRAPKFGIDTDKMIDVVLVSFICAFVGARAYYLIFDAKPLSSFGEIFAVRNGGLAIYGGVIGAFVSGYIMCRVKKIKVLAMYDLAALGFLSASIGGVIHLNIIKKKKNLKKESNLVLLLLMLHYQIHIKIYL